MAEAPLVGSNPECAASPWISTRKRPTPFRAVLSFPSVPNPGSRMNALAEALEIIRTYLWDSGLPISSSELMNQIGAAGNSKPRDRMARRAKIACTIPPFISKVPGP